MNCANLSAVNKSLHSARMNLEDGSRLATIEQRFFEVSGKVVPPVLAFWGLFLVWH